MAFVVSVLLAAPLIFAGGSSVNWVRVAESVPADHGQPPGVVRSEPDPALGPTGTTPKDTTVSARLLDEADDPDALVRGTEPADDLPRGHVAIPGIVLGAYLRAERILAAQGFGCRVPWWLLAGIGQVESQQAGNGEVDEFGNTLRPILGPVLNGDDGLAAIPAMDPQWSGGGTWARARGPMQFLEASWRGFGGGGNPNNVDDAALAAGRYLCASHVDLTTPTGRAVAVFSYNHSNEYVRIVLIWANAYRTGITPVFDVPAPVRPPLVTPPQVLPPRAPAYSGPPPPVAAPPTPAPSTPAHSPSAPSSSAPSTTAPSTTAPTTAAPSTRGPSTGAPPPDTRRSTSGPPTTAGPPPTTGCPTTGTPTTGSSTRTSTSRRSPSTSTDAGPCRTPPTSEDRDHPTPDSGLGAVP